MSPIHLNINNALWVEIIIFVTQFQDGWLTWILIVNWVGHMLLPWRNIGNKMVATQIVYERQRRLLDKTDQNSSLEHNPDELINLSSFIKQYRQILTRSSWASDHDRDLVAPVLLRIRWNMCIMTSEWSRFLMEMNCGVRSGGTGGGKAEIDHSQFYSGDELCVQIISKCVILLH